MNISADFGITVTDTIRKEEDKIIHAMDLSSDEISHARVRDLFPNFDFNSNKGFLAVTGGRHLELGNTIDSTPIIHVNEIDAIGEGSMNLAGLDKEESVIKLMTSFMLEVSLIGKLIGFNPFDQPAVEKVKLRIKKHLKQNARNKFITT